MTKDTWPMRHCALKDCDKVFSIAWSRATKKYCTKCSNKVRRMRVEIWNIKKLQSITDEEKQVLLRAKQNQIDDMHAIDPEFLKEVRL